MVTHDYERGMITGLPRSVVDEVRRTGKLPHVHPSMVDVWDALAEQRRHQLPPGMTVADIQRQRDGWDDAFDPEVWERLSGEKGAVAPPMEPKVPTGPGPSSPTIEDDPPPPESAAAWMCSCGQTVAEMYPLGSAELCQVSVGATPVVRRVALTGSAACGLGSCLVDEVNRINSAGVCYGPVGPNSNSTAFTLLASCGIPLVKPEVDTPGWGLLI